MRKCWSAMAVGSLRRSLEVVNHPFAEVSERRLRSGVGCQAGLLERDPLGRHSEVLPEIVRSFPVLEVEPHSGGRGLDSLGPGVLARCAELNLDQTAAALVDDVNATVAVGFGIGDVV